MLKLQLDEFPLVSASDVTGGEEMSEAKSACDGVEDASYATAGIGIAAEIFSGPVGWGVGLGALVTGLAANVVSKIAD